MIQLILCVIIMTVSNEYVYHNHKKLLEEQRRKHEQEIKKIKQGL